MPERRGKILFRSPFANLSNSRWSVNGTSPTGSLLVQNLTAYSLSIVANGTFNSSKQIVFSYQVQGLVNLFSTKVASPVNILFSSNSSVTQTYLSFNPQGPVVALYGTVLYQQSASCIAYTGTAQTSILLLLPLSFLPHFFSTYPSSLSLFSLSFCRYQCIRPFTSVG